MQTTRADVEQRIIEREWATKLSASDITWLDSPELDEFLEAWGELVSYYENNADDTEIGVEVLRSFVSYSRMLRNVLLNPASSDKVHEKAQETLTGLENSLEGIIREVVTYLDGNSRSD